MKSIWLVMLSLLLAGPAGADCITPWGMMIMEGMSVIAYRESRPMAGMRCDPQWRTCTHGMLTGWYTSQSCVEDMGCYGPVGYVPNGSSIVAYERPLAQYGEKCRSETRMCFNGQLSGTFSYSYCNQMP